jgi:hypothetical protein
MAGCSSRGSSNIRYDFCHWMTSMYDVGDVRYDPPLSRLDEATYQQPE